MFDSAGGAWAVPPPFSHRGSCWSPTEHKLAAVSELTQRGLQVPVQCVLLLLGREWACQVGVRLAPLTFSSPHNLHKKLLSSRSPEVRLQGHSTWGTARHSSMLWGTGLFAVTGFQEGRPQQCAPLHPGQHTLLQRPWPSFSLDIYPFSLFSARMCMCGVCMCVYV